MTQHRAQPEKPRMSKKPSKGEVDSLFDELTDLERWVSPVVDPSQWPPEGWAFHPSNPGLLYRVVTEQELREELFGSEAKTQWIESAKRRIEEIKERLSTYFFPNPKEEGTQRVNKGGYTTMLKTGLKREVDETALPVILTECKKAGFTVEGSVITYPPKFSLKEYRNLPANVRKVFDQALVVTPEKKVFEIAWDDTQQED